MEGLLNARYPPYEGKLKQLRMMGTQKANFDREGRVQFSFVSDVLSLGAGSKLGGLMRYSVVLIGELAGFYIVMPLLTS